MPALTHLTGAAGMPVLEAAPDTLRKLTRDVAEFVLVG